MAAVARSRAYGAVVRPEGYALLECDIDFRVGGKWRRCMEQRPGHAHWISGEYLEIEEPSRLSFTYINAYDGFETVVTMDFIELADGRTRMLFRQTPFISREEHEGHGWGWASSFELFGRYLLLFMDDDWRPQGSAAQRWGGRGYRCGAGPEPETEGGGEP